MRYFGVKYLNRKFALLLLFPFIYINCENLISSDVIDACERYIRRNDYQKLSHVLEANKSKIIDLSKDRPYSLLHYASGLPNVDIKIIEKLVSFGFDINQSSEIGKGFTPLATALCVIGFSNINIIVWMIRNNFVITDKYGKTIIDYEYAQDKYKTALEVIENEKKISLNNTVFVADDGDDGDNTGYDATTPLSSDDEDNNDDDEVQSNNNSTDEGSYIYRLINYIYETFVYLFG